MKVPPKLERAMSVYFNTVKVLVNFVGDITGTKFVNLMFPKSDELVELIYFTFLPQKYIHGYYLHTVIQK